MTGCVESAMSKNKKRTGKRRPTTKIERLMTKAQSHRFKSKIFGLVHSGDYIYCCTANGVYRTRDGKRWRKVALKYVPLRSPDAAMLKLTPWHGPLPQAVAELLTEQTPRIAHAAPSTSESQPNRFDQVKVPKGQRVLWITDTRDGATFVVGYEFKDLRPGEVDPLEQQGERRCTESQSKK